ncbi:MAG: CPBP family intramembrane metalloprotease, partial [Candidatus Heimdallarchaeota archaeon]|nr:CPBP family intramembrane metalloprotease [Candidatus Heimdallarchaeota archaeon]
VLIFSLQVFIIPLLRTLFNDGNPLPTTIEINIQRIVNGIVGVGLVYVFLNFDRQGMKVSGFQWIDSKAKEWILYSIPITLAGLIPTVIIESIFGIVIFHGILDIIGIILTLGVTLLAIGLGEEILFRGYLQRILQTRYSFEISAVISAFLFGLLHFWLASPSRSIYYMVAILFSAFMIGLTLSYTFKQTNYNLILPVAIHGFWDFFLFIFLAEFVYDTWLQVVMEISASTIGAIIIFLLVKYYSENYQKLPSETQ